jgi:hypothetical protein
MIETVWTFLGHLLDHMLLRDLDEIPEKLLALIILPNEITKAATARFCPDTN